jgi:hypothetical protein
MRAITLLDPLAPMCWRGLALWPDGIGTALAAAQGDDPDVVGRLEDIIVREEAANWAAMRPDRCDVVALSVDARRHHSWLQQRGQIGGSQQLTYLLNPLMPCASPLVAGRWVARLTDLLPALEATATKVDHRQVEPVDSHVGAFVAARLERRMDAGGTDSGAAYIAQLRMLADLQSRESARSVPDLAAWLVDRAGPVLATWRNRKRRAALEERLRTLTASGSLAPLLQALEDPVERNADAREAQQASETLVRIDAELAHIAVGGPARAATASRLGQEIAAGFGLAALATVLAVAALS